MMLLVCAGHEVRPTSKVGWMDNIGTEATHSPALRHTSSDNMGHNSTR